MNAIETMALRTIQTRVKAGGLRLSNHAMQRSLERGITRGMMISAITAATKCQQQSPTKFAITVVMDGREGRIVVEPKAGDLVEVVSTMWRTK